MFKRILLLLFIGSVFCQNTPIAVFDFENNGLDSFAVKQISTRLESELVKTGKFKVIERGKIDQLLKEQKFQMSDNVEETIIEIGMFLGAQEIVYGSIGKIGNYYTISAKLVNVTSGEIIRASNIDYEGDINNLLRNGLSRIASDLTGVGDYKSPTHKIILSAESSATYAHNRAPYFLLGAGSCAMFPIGIPLSFLYDRFENNNTAFDTNDPSYLELTNEEDRRIYVNAYKKKERSLRKRSLHGTQAYCLLFYILMVSLVIDDVEDTPVE